MPYGKNEIKLSNVNYVGKDFNDLKKSLMQYVQSYFPNTYKDFNETSPGMMLVELSAYVGDVLNFYIDQQYKEMMIPLAEERKNLITLAKSHGYKVNPISPAYADLQFTTTLRAKGSAGAASGTGGVDYTDPECVTLEKGVQLNASGNSNMIFETLDVVDFKVSSSADIAPIVSSVDPTTGSPLSYTVIRKVKAISGKTTTTQFTITEPKKFLKLTLQETNVIEILKVVDTNTIIWYEVANLAIDKVSTAHHYSSDSGRNSAYIDKGGNVIKTPVPYSLEFIKTKKRFITEIDEENRTSLIFGNGILKNGNDFSDGFLAIEQIGINLPGGEENMEDSIDPLMGDAYGTLGQSPSHTTLTVTYRVGGGISSNVKSNVISNIVSRKLINGSSTVNLSCKNPSPAAGGSSGESLEEIRHRVMAHISTQSRCVSKQDYEARSLNMPAKFGNIAKVYCARAGAVKTAQREKVADMVNRLKDIINKNYDMFDPGTGAGEKIGLLNDIKLLLDADQSGGLNKEDFEMLYETLDMTFTNISDDDRLYTIDLYLLSYDNNKNLIATPNIIKQNLKTYLNEFRLLTDQVSFYDGYVVNFGVVFDIVGQQYENKDQIKVNCIDAIKNYFRVEKMQFKQLLYTNDITNILMEVDGVRSVNYATITQDFDYNADGGGGGTEDPIFDPPLYTITINSDGTTSTSAKKPGYGYYYNFSEFYGGKAMAGRGIVLPAYEPAVFELKDPNNNIKGVVR